MGEFWILPTDTVYGIVADSRDIKAVKRIYDVKKRPRSNPINILVSNENMIKSVTRNISYLERKAIKEFFPGALTIIFEKNKKISDIITAGLDTVGIRMPDNSFLLELIEYIRTSNCCNKL